MASNSGGWFSNPNPNIRANRFGSDAFWPGVPFKFDQYLGRINTRALAEALLYQARLEMGNDIKYNVLIRLEDGLNAWAKSLYQSSESRDGLAEMNAEMARDVQDVIVKAYERSQRKGRRVPSYRYAEKDKRLRRYANKQMLRALQSESFITSGYNGIAFPNIDFMDQAAPQWYRLNFGAAPLGNFAARSPGQNMKWGADRQYQTSTNINFMKFGPSGAFNVPSLRSGEVRGIWSKAIYASSPTIQQIKKGYTGFYSGNPNKMRGAGGRGSALYLIPAMGSGLGFQAKQSRGILGAHFLDEGAEFLNKEYGKRLSRIFNDWHGKAVKEGRAKAQRRSVVSIGDSTFNALKEISAQKVTKVSNPTDSPEQYMQAFGVSDLSKAHNNLLDKWRKMGFDLTPFGVE